MALPTNIAALVPYQVYPAKMGGQKGIALFYQYLSQQLPVTIISVKKNEFPVSAAINFVPLLENSRLRYINPFLFFKMRSLLREKKITTLIIEHPYFGWLGFLLKKLADVKLIVHSHNIESLRFQSTGKWWWRILYQYERLVHQVADINFFISDEDRQFALKNFHLDPQKCHTITYGIEESAPPANDTRTNARELLCRRYEIPENTYILLFNGTLDYKPNLDAVDAILHEINPGLLRNNRFRYKIIICGKNLPGRYNKLTDYSGHNIIYAGFVEDIKVYFNGADVFINPVKDGGGIKTKLVEALGAGLYAVSTANGAIGVHKSISGNKLQIIPNGDWEAFTNAIFEVNTDEKVPETFFNYFYWGNIAVRAAKIIKYL